MAFDIHQRVFDANGEYLEDEAIAYREQLVQLFEASPEAQTLSDKGQPLGWADMMLDLAIGYEGVTPPQMTPAHLRTLLFDLIPRKISAPSTDASDMIGELRAFWTFLGRAFQLPNAAACLRVLGGSAERKLAAALADPANFGMAKSLLTRGMERGFDLASPEGLQAWVDTYNAELQAGIGQPIPWPGFMTADWNSGTPRASKPAARKKRKAAQDPRKHNRGKK
jgi:hypothetical protein